MKNLIHTLVLAAFMLAANSCQEDGPQMGCQTGILKTGDPNERLTIRCCTKEEHNAGSNTNIGGTELFTYYSSVKWEEVSSCDKCD